MAVAGGDRDSRLNGAKVVGLNGTISGTFKRNDLDDLVRLNVSERSSFNLDLTGIAKKNNVDVQLYRFLRPVNDVLKSIGKTDFRKLKAKDRNSNFQFVAQSANGKNRNESIAVNLEQGDFFIRFLRKQGNNTKYVATLKSAPIKTTPGQENLLPPTATGDSFTTPKGTPLVISAASLLGNDSDPNGDILTIAGVTAPGNGTLIDNSNGTYTYTPKANFFGGDNFSYTVSDGKGGSSTATVSLTVTGSDTGPGGSTQLQPPVAKADSFTAKEGTSFVINSASLLANDTDPNGDKLTIVNTTAPSNGTLVKNNGTYTYTSKLGFATDSFTYTISDGKGGTSTATVGLNITPLPVLKADSKISGKITTSETEKRYTINLTGGDFEFKLSGLNGPALDSDADLELYSADGKLLRSSTNVGTTIDGFVAPLEAGKYVVRVLRKENNTKEVNFALAVAKLTDKFGNTEQAADNLGTLSTTSKNLVNYVVTGAKASTADYFKFNLPDRGFVSVRLTGTDQNGTQLFGDLDFEVYAEGNSDNKNFSGAGLGKVAEQSAGTLGGNTTYFLKVHPQGASDGSTYSVTLSYDPRNGKPSKVRDINYGSGSSTPANLTAANGFAYFTTSSNGKTSLWQSTGTIDKTSKIYDFSNFNPNPSNFTTVNQQLYFVVNDGTNGRELWTSDGTTVGTKLVKDFDNSANDSNPSGLTAVDDTLYFYTDIFKDGKNEQALYRLKQGEITPQAITSPDFNTILPDFQNLTNVSETLYFSAKDEDGNGDGEANLWRIAANGTAEKMLLNPDEDSFPSKMMNVGGNLFLSAFVKVGSSTATKLIRIDKFSTGAYDKANFTIFNNDNLNTNPDNLLYVESTKTLYFTGDATGTGVELQKLQFTNDTSETVTPTVVKDIKVGVSSSSPSSLLSLSDGRVVFLANDGSGSGNVLWITDGTDANTVKLSSLAGLSELDGLNSNSIEQLKLVNDKLFFVATDAANGKELRKITLTANQGTLETFDINTQNNGADNSSPTALTVVGGQLFFAANDGLTGIEPWSILG